jgi:hypothetical protein
LRRQKPGFEASLDRLRQATTRIGPDTAIARAVLLSNFDRPEMALDQVRDALSCRPTVPYLPTFKAWLSLQAPEDRLSSDEVKRLLRELQAAFETPPDTYHPYFVRALLHAAAGDWAEARYDLSQCRRLLGQDALPTSNSVYAGWYARSNGHTTDYLDATQEVLAALSAPVNVRIRLGETVLGRLNDAGIVAQEGLAAPDVLLRKGWTHYKLARAYAEKDDRPRGLQHMREALELKLADLKPETFRGDVAFAAWKDDPEFQKLAQ